MGIGLQWSGANDAMAQGIRQRIIDQIQQRQAEQEMSLKSQDMQLRQSQDARQAEEHAAAMKSLDEQRTEGEAAKGAAGLSVNQSIPAPMAMRLRGTMQAANMQDNPPLSQPPNMPDMMQPDVQPGSQPGAVWMGNDAQRTGEEQKQIRGRLMSNPALDPRERLAIEMENAGMKVPAGVFGPKPTTHLVQAMKDGKPTYVNEADAEGMTPYEKPQNAPTNSYQLQPEIDATGKQTGRFLGYNTKTNGWEPVQGEGPAMTKAGPGAAQAAAQEASKHEALGSLDQLDQAIESARDLIGPGAGRVSSIQQMIGSQDPRINALGTKMLMTKMQVDHAAAGSVRAGASPQILSRWDNILGNKVTPEALKASVQAMREILGGGGAAAAVAPTGKRIVYDTNGRPVQQ